MLQFFEFSRFQIYFNNLKALQRPFLNTVPEALTLPLTRQKIAMLRLISEFDSVISSKFSKISQKS